MQRLLILFFFDKSQRVFSYNILFRIWFILYNYIPTPTHRYHKQFILSIYSQTVKPASFLPNMMVTKIFTPIFAERNEQKK